MKAYIINEKDFERLLTMIDRDPGHGRDGGSSQSSVRDRAVSIVYDEAHSFYNYQVRKWISEVQQ